MMKKLSYLAIIIAFLTNCGTKQVQENKPENVVHKVTTTTVESVKKLINLRYSGTVEPSQTIPISFQTTGTVEKVLVDAGDEVKKGQVLAIIDKTDLQNMYDITLAKYQQAKDAYDRLKKVHEQGSLQEIKWVEMETNMAQAKSSLDLSKNNLDKCFLRSPVDAIVGRRNIEPGMYSLNPASAPFELVELRNVYIKISVPENEIGKIQKGIKANFIVSALNNQSFEGVVTKISPVADAISRTYEIKILVNNTKLELKPGMVCDVTLNLQSEKEVLIIPYQSVTKDKDGKTYVFVVNEDKRVKKQIIQTGNYSDGSIIVSAGLTSGQIIINEGKERLVDNSLISL